MPSKTITDLDLASTIVGDELVEISQVSTTVRIVASTISAQASDNSYNHSGNGFITAGFAVGDRVRVTGFTGNTVNNILVGKITALTAGKMTIGGTDGDVIVDDAAGETVTIAKWTSRRVAIGSITGASPTESLIVAVGDETTPMVTGVARVTFRMPYAFTLTAVRASLTTASSSGIPTIDINDNGVSILSTRITIDVGEKTSVTAATPPVISTPNLANDDEMTIDIDVAGTGATGLKVVLIGQRA